MTDPILGWFRLPTATDPGTLNVCYAAIDRPVITGRSDELVLSGPEPVTFATMLEDVAAFAGALAGLGIGPGKVALMDLADDVDTAVGRLACARVGAVSVSPSTGLASAVDSLMPAVILSSRHAELAAVLEHTAHQPDACIVRGDADLDPTRDIAWDLAVKAGRTDPAGCAKVPADAPYSFDAGVRTVLEQAERVARLTQSPVSAAQLRAALEG